jgi:hypothetical protein
MRAGYGSSPTGVSSDNYVNVYVEYIRFPTELRSMQQHGKPEMAHQVVGSSLGQSEISLHTGLGTPGWGPKHVRVLLRSEGRGVKHGGVTFF